MFVIGTAGHVDHGKSTLVQALTGIDPDRLREEKERGMTIDLGFAWLKLPSGREVSIVDVPGHERFVKNMLAGVGGIDLALFIVAADEGMMPQTREHLAILDLLRVERGVIVLTKRDIVDEEWLELVTADVRSAFEGTTLADAPLLAVSAVTGQGLPELLDVLDGLLQEATPRRDTGRPRLPVDRVFTIAGFGTVVTGTLIDGSLRTGQEVELLPQGIKTRLRGLQTHRHKVDVASPGSRVAANLTNVSTEDLARGNVVTAPGWLRPITVFDAQVRLLKEVPNPLRHNASCTVHLLASETPAKLRLLDANELEPGAVGWAQLRVQFPLVLCKGDAFIIRSAFGTIGGGTVVEPQAKRHRRFHQPTLASLQTLAQGTPEGVMLQQLARGPVAAGTLLKTAAISHEEAERTLSLLVEQGDAVALNGRLADPHSLVMDRATWQRLNDHALRLLAEFHKASPLRAGMSKEELRSRLRLPGRAAADALDLMVQEGMVEERGAVVCLPGYEVALSPSQQQQARQLLAALELTPYSPPSDLPFEADIANVLTDQGRLVRVGESIYFSAPAYQEMVSKITAHLQKNRTITVAEVRDMFNTSRKYALALMEYLDQQHLTRRVGDQRVLR